MQSLEKRIAALEAAKGTDLSALSDEELEAWIAEVKERIAADKAAQAVISKEIHHEHH